MLSRAGRHRAPHQHGCLGDRRSAIGDRRTRTGSESLDATTGPDGLLGQSRREPVRASGKTTLIDDFLDGHPECEWWGRPVRVRRLRTRRARCIELLRAARRQRPVPVRGRRPAWCHRRAAAAQLPCVPRRARHAGGAGQSGCGPRAGSSIVIRSSVAISNSPRATASTFVAVACQRTMTGSGR